MKYIIVFIITISTLFSYQPTDLKDKSWKLEKSKNGIDVYSRTVDGSAIKEGRITLIVKARLSAVVAILEDVNNQPDWLSKTLVAEVIETDHQGKIIYYTVGDFPWPLFDRDSVQSAHMYQDKDTGIVYLSSSCASGIKPVVKGLVRVDLIDKEVTIEPLSKGTTKIDYRVRADPGGNIPAWLVNLFFDRDLINNFETMREHIKKPKYRDAELSYINEKF